MFFVKDLGTQAPEQRGAAVHRDGKDVRTRKRGRGVMTRTELEWCQAGGDTRHVKGAILCENSGNGFLRCKGPGDEGGQQDWKERRLAWPELGRLGCVQGFGVWWSAALIPEASGERQCALAGWARQGKAGLLSSGRLGSQSLHGLP